MDTQTASLFRNANHKPNHVTASQLSSRQQRCQKPLLVPQKRFQDRRSREFQRIGSAKAKTRPSRKPDDLDSEFGPKNRSANSEEGSLTGDAKAWAKWVQLIAAAEFTLALAIMIVNVGTMITFYGNDWAWKPHGFIISFNWGASALVMSGTTAGKASRSPGNTALLGSHICTAVCAVISLGISIFGAVFWGNWLSESYGTAARLTLKNLLKAETALCGAAMFPCAASACLMFCVPDVEPDATESIVKANKHLSSTPLVSSSGHGDEHETAFESKSKPRKSSRVTADNGFGAMGQLMLDHKRIVDAINVNSSGLGIPDFGSPASEFSWRDMNADFVVPPDGLLIGIHGTDLLQVRAERVRVFLHGTFAYNAYGRHRQQAVYQDSCLLAFILEFRIRIIQGDHQNNEDLVEVELNDSLDSANCCDLSMQLSDPCEEAAGIGEKLTVVTAECFLDKLRKIVPGQLSKILNS